MFFQYSVICHYSKFIRIVKVHELAERERGQYQAILTEQAW